MVPTRLSQRRPGQRSPAARSGCGLLDAQRSHNTAHTSVQAPELPARCRPTTLPHVVARLRARTHPPNEPRGLSALPVHSHLPPTPGRTAEEYGESRCPHAAARASAAHSSPSAVAHGFEGIGTAGAMGVICWQSRSTMARICAVVLSAHTPEPSAPAAVNTGSAGQQPKRTGGADRTYTARVADALLRSACGSAAY